MAAYVVVHAKKKTMENMMNTPPLQVLAYWQMGAKSLSVVRRRSCRDNPNIQ